jgi:hypothetical protein
MTDNLDTCRRQAFEYGATSGQPGFDQRKLHDMVGGCAHRQELLRVDLNATEEKMLRRLIGKEPHGLWS